MPSKTFKFQLSRWLGCLFFVRYAYDIHPYDWDYRWCF